MLRNVFKIIIVFVVGMVGGIFANQIFWPYFVERPLFYQYSLEPRAVYLTEKKEIYIQENVALKEAVEKVEKVVIGVRSETGAGKILEGSGLILTADGLIITLAELVPQGADFNFFIEGEEVAYEIIKRDLEKNLVLIRVEKTRLPTAAFADLEKLKLGERVFLVGAVFDGKEIKKAVNEGIVGSFDKNSIETNIFEKTALAGSPLFNIEGRIVGINIVDKDGRVGAIPVSQIRLLSNL